MMHAIESAMRADIKSIDWMSQADQGARTRKARTAWPTRSAIRTFWLDYSELKIVRGDALGNAERAADFALRHDIAKIGKPIDRSEWSTSAPTNNSYYDDQAVDITIPAGVLQPPNFDVTADDAINYGNLGSLIGHELTHRLR